MSVTKQLIMSKLPLPKVLIGLIKEYTFTNIEEKAKRSWKDITDLISASPFTGKEETPLFELEKNEWIFWVNDVGCPQHI